jgi:hypothetical protein
MGEEGLDFGDALESDGYLSSYPNNPFLTKKAVIIYGEDSAQWGSWCPWRCCGGRSGRSMFNLGWSGEGPSLMAYDIDGEPDNSIKFEFPGEFFYHPRFGDGADNASHFSAQYTSISSGGTSLGGNHVTALGASVRVGMVWSHDVAGYDLLGYGDPSTSGMDIDYPIAGSWYKDYAKRTGYLNNVPESNPYNAGNAYAPRTQPDGIPDYYIIHLSSSQDAKPQGVG